MESFMKSFNTPTALFLLLELEIQTSVKYIGDNINYYQRRQRMTQNLVSIPFVSYDQTTGFVLHQQAVTAINSLNQEKQISVLAAIGKTKTGKSYLLNKLISKFVKEKEEEIQAFQVCNSVEGGTKGIRILPIELERNIIIILEMQGLGNLQNNPYSQEKLFAITLLLSSILLYNTRGPLDEQSLQGLSILVGIGKLLQHTLLTKTKKRWQLPQLYMVLRDFSLILQDKKGEEISVKQYFEGALEQQKGTSKVVLNKNRIRRVLKQIFSRRECMSLSYPSEDIPIKKTSLLRKQFEQQIADLSQKLGKKIGQSNKKINGISLNSTQWLTFAGQLINSINNQTKEGGLKLESIVLQVFRQQQRAIQEKFYSKTQTMLKKNLFRSQQTFSTLQMFTSMELSQIEERISQCRSELSNLKNELQKQYVQACREMQELIEKQGGVQMKLQNMNFNNPSLAKIKDFSEIYRWNEDVSKKLAAIQQQMQQKLTELTKINKTNKQVEMQKQVFDNIVQQISLYQNEKELDSIYINFINTLRNNNSAFDSKTLQSYLLKLQVAYLRRKIQLKDRQEISKICAATHSSFALKDKNVNFNSAIKSQKNQKYLNEFRKNSVSKFQLKQTNILVQNQNKKSLLVPYLNIKPENINIQILRTFVKQDTRGNNYVEYTLEVVLDDKRWTFNRRWKDFNQLHNILAYLFDKKILPSFTPGQIIMNEVNVIRKQEIQIRRFKLESYIRELLYVELVRNSRIFQKFLKINKEYVPFL